MRIEHSELINFSIGRSFAVLISPFSHLTRFHYSHGHWICQIIPGGFVNELDSFTHMFMCLKNEALNGFEYTRLISREQRLAHLSALMKKQFKIIFAEKFVAQSRVKSFFHLKLNIIYTSFI